MRVKKMKTILLLPLQGAWGALFTKLNLRWCQFRKSSKLGKYPIVEATSVACLTAICSYPNPYTRQQIDIAKYNLFYIVAFNRHLCPRALSISLAHTHTHTYIYIYILGKGKVISFFFQNMHVHVFTHFLLICITIAWLRTN